MLVPLTRSDVLVQFTLLMASVANGFSSSNNSPTHCAIVGVGVLGTSLCRQILQDTDWTVTGITKTTNHHDEIRQAMPAAEASRLTLTTREAVPSEAKFPNVVFCAPPSGAEDYPSEVKDAVDSLWSGPDEGVFCFTSSGGIYAVETGIVTETTPITVMTPRVEKFVNTEKVVTDAGGCAMRLAGLYTLQRGAHGFYFGTDKPIQGSPNGLVNQLHYDDAAGACLAALQAGPSVCRGQTFLISDGHPQSRLEICESALKSAAYRRRAMPTFANEPDPTKPGKRYDGSFSNDALKWKPKYESFDKFMGDNA